MIEGGATMHSRPACAFSSRPAIPPGAGASGEISLQLTAFFTSAAIFASSAAVNFFSAKEVGHMLPSSRFASSLKPNVAYLYLNLSAAVKKQTTSPSLLAYAGIPYQVFGERDGALAVMISWIRRAMTRSASGDRKSTRLNSSHQLISYAV